MSTLSVPTLLATTLDSFKTRVPQLSMISLDARNDALRLGQTEFAHIRTLPTAAQYDSSTGYFNGANQVGDLLVDVPVVVDQHWHVTLNLSHLAQLSDQKIDESLSDAAYVLGKRVFDFGLSRVVAANASNFQTTATANVTKETLSEIRQRMNQNGAAPIRFGLVNSAIATELDNDPLITSGDYYNQRSEAQGYLGWRNVAGFSEIMEYSDLPTTGNMTGVFFDPRFIAVRTAVPSHVADLAARLNIPAVANFEVQQDPNTGIALMAIMHAQPGTLNYYMTLTLLYGASVGKQNGANGTITDRAGVILRSAAP